MRFGALGCHGRASALTVHAVALCCLVWLLPKRRMGAAIERAAPVGHAGQLPAASAIGHHRHLFLYGPVSNMSRTSPAKTLSGRVRAC